MNAEILAVGTEILLGDIVNTNAQYLARELAGLGIGVLHQSVVGDNSGRLAQEIKESLSRCDILITSAGLGPTGDDITRETVAKVLGLPLEPDEESLKSIEEYFRKTGRGMSENNKKQALMPKGSVVFKNDRGTAPGSAIEKDGKVVIMLPGPPREMYPMFENYVKPYLAKFSDSVIASVSLREFGIPESHVQEMLDDLMRGQNPTLSPYAKTGEVVLRVTAKAEAHEKALMLCRPVIEQVKKRLGANVYGENVDSLEQVVVQKLIEKKLKVGLAESCTGGFVAKRITEIPGSSEIFECGIVSYANRIKEEKLSVRHETLESHGAVSAETAYEMAIGARRAAGSDIGVGITGIAGPEAEHRKNQSGLSLSGYVTAAHAM